MYYYYNLLLLLLLPLTTMSMTMTTAMLMTNSTSITITINNIKHPDPNVRGKASGISGSKKGPQNQSKAYRLPDPASSLIRKSSALRE